VCTNCGSPRVERFCPQCGQQVASPLQPLGEIISDAAGEFLKFDSKLLITLKSLLLRPGFLTTEYLCGRRAPYIAPFRLYLWISAFYFILFATGPQKEFERNFVVEPQKNMFASVTVPNVTIPSPATATKASGAASASATDAQKETKKQRIERMQRRLGDGMKWFSENMSAVMIFLIPLDALLLSLLYVRYRRLYVEHLIAQLHIQSFSLLIAIPLMVILPYFKIDFATGSFFVSLTLVPVYIFLTLRRIYAQSVGKTMLKAFLLNMGHFVLAMLLGAGIAIFCIFWPG
jgi:hypothetical protein